MFHRQCLAPLTTTFLFAEKRTSLFAEKRTFLFTKKRTLLFTDYSRVEIDKLFMDKLSNVLSVRETKTDQSQKFTL